MPAGPFSWTVDGVTYDMDTSADFLGTMLRQVRRTLWQTLSYQEHYRGLHIGRNETATNSLRRSLDPQQVAFLDIIHTDSIYTPWRAHIRWGKTETGHCTMCGTPVARWSLYVDECVHIKGRPYLPSHHPNCFRYTGCVPSGYCEAPKSVQMEERPIFHFPQNNATPIIIATDGGCRKSQAGPRASWGLATNTHYTRGGAVFGPLQTAQRGEVTALAHALTISGQKKF